jgi:Zn-finger nucleic acid-binding protein
MQCPTDGAVLVMSERSGIEIDYCPTCRGVWLDRGELDKIIERSLSQPAPEQPVPQQPQQHAAPPAQYQQPYQQQQQSHQQGYRKPKRKESWLSELFD